MFPLVPSNRLNFEEGVNDAGELEHVGSVVSISTKPPENRSNLIQKLPPGAQYELPKNPLIEHDVPIVGELDGMGLGYIVGSPLGTVDGTVDGSEVGMIDGMLLGLADGCADGTYVGV